MAALSRGRERAGLLGLLGSQGGGQGQALHCPFSVSPARAKSSHTNSHDNAGTLPKGFKKVVLHDDAFQIDCRATNSAALWEPTLFDKTDSRPLGHEDWKIPRFGHEPRLYHGGRAR